MTQEEKELLLQDLSARLSYGVFVYTPLFDDEIHKVTGMRREIIEFQCRRKKFDDIYEFFNPIYTEYEDVWDCKPCLRSMNSMTEEEKEEFDEITLIHTPWGVQMDRIPKLVDWLNKKMFDYRGLIPMGLALEAPEGMYKENNPYE